MENFFSKNIKYLREQRGLSQNKFAEMLDVNQTTIARWEDENRIPTIDKAIQVSKILNIPLNILLGKNLKIENIELNELPLDNNVIEKLSLKSETFSSRLKKIMKERNLKQIDIIKLCEPYFEKYQTIIQLDDLKLYINGNAEPNEKKIMILANALNVSLTWLMGLDDESDYKKNENIIINKELINLSLNEIETNILENKNKYIKLLTRLDLEYILVHILFPETNWITNKYIDCYKNFVNNYGEIAIKNEYLYKIKYHYILCVLTKECNKDEIINELCKIDFYKDFCSHPKKRKELIEQYFKKNRNEFVATINDVLKEEE